MKTLFHPFFVLMAHIINSHLVEQIEYLKVENRILRSKLGPRVRVTPEERSQLLRFGKPLGPALKDLISIVRYETFRNWVRGHIYQGSGKVGRPAVPEEIRLLIIQIALENRTWGYKRILGELKKLNIEVSRSSIQNILREAGLEPQPNRKHSSWRKFIKNHMNTLIACDFFTKEVWTLRGRVTMYVFFFIELKTRRLHIAGVTRYPKQKWVEQRAKEVIEAMNDSGFQPKYLIRDRDGKFSEKFDEIMKENGIEAKKIPARMPLCNVYAERACQSIKHECLNHFTVFGKHHLKYLLEEYENYFNRYRPHQAIGNVPIEGLPYPPKDGKIEKVDILGGLLNHYERKAA